MKPSKLTSRGRRLGKQFFLTGLVVATAWAFGVQPLRTLEALVVVVALVWLLVGGVEVNVLVLQAPDDLDDYQNGDGGDGDELEDEHVSPSQENHVERATFN